MSIIMEAIEYIDKLNRVNGTDNHKVYNNIKQRLIKIIKHNNYEIVRNKVIELNSNEFKLKFGIPMSTNYRQLVRYSDILDKIGLKLKIIKMRHR